MEAIINNIMAKELLGPSVGSKEEQLQRKQQILEELHKVGIIYITLKKILVKVVH